MPVPSLRCADAVCASASQRRRSGERAAGVHAIEWPTHAASVGRGTERADVPGMRCCCSCFGANGAARCDGVALVLMQAGRVSPARSSDGSLVNFRPNRRCCEHRYRRKWLYLRRACAVPMRVERPAHARNTRQSVVALSELMCLVCGAVAGRYGRPTRTARASRSWHGGELVTDATELPNGRPMPAARASRSWH